MSHGILTPAQRDIVKHFVLGRLVHDFGAGDLGLAHTLVELGAVQVVAIDNHDMPEPSTPKILRVQELFAAYYERLCPTELDVAFVSWPRELTNVALLGLVARSKVCIYLGKNTDVSACGGQELFWHFLGRRCLAYVPDRKNVLIVLGESVGVKTRPPHGEEIAALDRTTIYSFEEAEAKSL